MNEIIHHHLINGACHCVGPCCVTKWEQSIGIYEGHLIEFKRKCRCAKCNHECEVLGRLIKWA